MFNEGMANDFEAKRKTQFEVNRIRDIMYLAKSTQLAVYAMLELRDNKGLSTRSVLAGFRQRKAGNQRRTCEAQSSVVFEAGRN